jgi:predicted nucleic acid-binding protein
VPDQAYISEITVAELRVSVRTGKERAALALTEFLDTMERLPLGAELAADCGVIMVKVTVLV